VTELSLDEAVSLLGDSEVAALSRLDIEETSDD